MFLFDKHQPGQDPGHTKFRQEDRKELDKIFIPAKVGDVELKASVNRATRSSAGELDAKFDQILRSRCARPKGVICPERERVVMEAFDEVLRQTWVASPVLGKLIYRVRQDKAAEILYHKILSVMPLCGLGDVDPSSEIAEENRLTSEILTIEKEIAQLLEESAILD